MLAAILASTLIHPVPLAGQCTWSAVAGDPNGLVRDLVVHDDGSGPMLFAAGTFTAVGSTVGVPHVAKWDGLIWQPVGSVSFQGGHVNALAVFDYGTGPKLYAGGDFWQIGGVAANHIACWDGNTWAPLTGGGIGTGPFDGWVQSLLVFDDGTGPALYVGGSFSVAGGVPAQNIARWDGISWSSLGSGIGPVSLSAVECMAGFDEGGWPPKLYVGGTFQSAGGVTANGIARWDGLGWTDVGGGVSRLGAPPRVSALAVFDGGSGERIYAGGQFDQAGTVASANLASWNGSSWSSTGSGLTGNLPASVKALTVFDAGNGPRLVVGGGFTLAGGLPANSLAAWDGSSWSDFSWGTTSSPSQGLVLSLASFDDGFGARLHAGGSIFLAGSGPLTTERLIVLSCPRPLAVSALQPLGPGMPVHIRAAGLVAGNEYFILYSSSPCPGPPGSGPLLGLCAATPQDLQFLLLQLMNPLGSPASHFIATGTDMSWGPLMLPPLTVDALCIDVTNVPVSFSSVARMIIQ